MKHSDDDGVVLLVGLGHSSNLGQELVLDVGAGLVPASVELLPSEVPVEETGGLEHLQGHEHN